MKLYLKILFSTILGALAFSILFVVGSIVLKFDPLGLGFVGQRNIFPDFIPGLTLVIAAVGFVVFGIAGSTVWYLLYRFIFYRRKSTIKAHAWSAAIGATLPPLIMIIGESNRVLYSLSTRDIMRHISGHADDYLEFLAFSVPGGFLSLFIYWLLFLRSKTAQNKSNWLRDNSSNQR